VKTGKKRGRDKYGGREHVCFGGGEIKR